MLFVPASKLILQSLRLLCILCSFSHILGVYITPLVCILTIKLGNLAPSILYNMSLKILLAKGSPLPVTNIPNFLSVGSVKNISTILSFTALRLSYSGPLVYKILFTLQLGHFKLQLSSLLKFIKRGSSFIVSLFAFSASNSNRLAVSFLIVSFIVGNASS